MIRTKGSTRITPSIVRLATLCVTLSVLCSASNAALKSPETWKIEQEKMAKIKNAHYTEKITFYLSDGRINGSVAYESWIKTPYKWRRDDKVHKEVMITDKDKCWGYFQYNNTYTVKNLDKPVGAPLTQFVPDWQIENLRSGGASVSEPKKVVHNGVECSVIEITPSATTKANHDNNSKAHIERLVLYIDQATGLLIAKTTQIRRVDGTLQSEEQDEYDYNKQEMPDDFFLPPADAKQVEVKGATPAPK